MGLVCCQGWGFRGLPWGLGMLFEIGILEAPLQIQT